jgi:hypothetical protein
MYDLMMLFEKNREKKLCFFPSANTGSYNGGIHICIFVAKFAIFSLGVVLGIGVSDSIRDFILWRKY